MARVSEEISKANTVGQGKTDANLSQDSNHLGGISADDYATKKYVQEYHDTKEGSLKNYIDSQDQSMLNQAKEYTNAMVRNQDFSEFAKLTDVQALDKKLTEDLTEGLTAQKNYTDQKTQAIVNDVNSNFQNVENSINSLNGSVNNLFQSVSSGKSQIAGAITDKGVSTSANDSFSTMANNIRAISSGGGEIDPNFVNTSDGNATSEDIRLGKIAYAKGQKIYGSLVPEGISTDDATAVASDILLGKTAYVKGEKVYGTLIQEAEPGMPTYGTDTSNATAVASDILYGKTAYARGQLLVGTLRNTEVEEIYGINVNEYEFRSLYLPTQDDETEEAITRTCLAFSKDLNFCVSAVTIGENKYVESYPIGENGVYTIRGEVSVPGGSINTGPKKKYRYTYEELGLGNETIYSMGLGQKGVDGDNKLCYLMILSELHNEESNNYTLRVHGYSYHLEENGQIGKLYENEEMIIENLVEDIKTSSNSFWRNTYHTISANLDPERFMIFTRSTFYSVLIGRNIVLNPYILIHDYSFSQSYGLLEGSAEFSDDDRYIQSNTENTPSTTDYHVYEDGVLAEVDTFGGYYYDFITSGGYAHRNLHGTDYFLRIESESSGFNIDFITKDNDIDENVATISVDYSILPSTSDTRMIFNFLILPDNKKIFAIIADRYYSRGSKARNPRMVTIELEGDTIETLEAKVTSYIDLGLYIPWSSGSNTTNLVHNEDYSKIFLNYNSSMYGFFADTDEKLVGVKYKNKYFYATDVDHLTATTNDVRVGKTFIGANKVPQLGTMEVSEQ